jgi:hypothetical protein
MSCSESVSALALPSSFTGVGAELRKSWLGLWSLRLTLVVGIIAHRCRPPLFFGFLSKRTLRNGGSGWYSAEEPNVVWSSSQTRKPAEFKHITKRRKRN